MNKLNVGDYVRTECGIAKIESFETKNKEIINLDKDIMLCNMDIYRTCCTINQIIKSSPNIIDLIEVGDYVNGKEVFNPNGLKWLYKNMGDEVKDVKSIVTKEQFENISYKVGE